MWGSALGCEGKGVGGVNKCEGSMAESMGGVWKCGGR